MRRNFRRDLVLLLIAGDLGKNVVYMVFSIQTFVHGQVHTASAFCTGTGYALQMSLGSCDIAIFLMSLHMSLQIFPPTGTFSALLGADGLYNVRRWAITAWFIIPNLMAALAFINPGHAFMTTGAFCTLPLRPIWYRLALSWIPRYLIWVFVMGVAIRIYCYVGREFKVFGMLQDGSSSQRTSDKQSLDTDTSEGDQLRFMKHPVAPCGDAAEDRGDDEIAPDDIRTQAPMPVTHNKQWSFLTPEWQPGKPPSCKGSLPSSRRGSRQIAPGVMAEDFAPPPAFDYTQHRGSIITTTTFNSAATQSNLESAPTSSRGSKGRILPTPQDTINPNRRRSIQRHLRLLFIYPILYMLMWIVPFIVHCLNYSDYFAQHPIFPLTATNTFCQTFMGFVDVVVFCWREKPWRHISGSDGTVEGSFQFWRFCRREGWIERRMSRARPLSNGSLNDSEAERGSDINLVDRSSQQTTKPPREHRRMSRLNVIPHRRTHSSGTDRRIVELERARERLALERKDWAVKQQSLLAKKESALSAHTAAPSATIAPPKKEWWDGYSDEAVTEVDNDKEGSEGVSKARIPNAGQSL
ncbi:Hypothetical protein R9X50_00728100 [Acrodontium crateriforme]|uniref:G protein-coupled receptor GPR1 n=1 Tax=Acrodontium crateriforme TaxID=150365 RepID=A0AAQ3MAS7_9PEZI|nr:Hypothetical protein R9X50_00728100 [Acrodontium crateriforme]